MGPTRQRAVAVLDLLDAARGVTAEQAISIAFLPLVYKADLWQERIRKAAGDGSEFVRLLLGWNRRSDADSRAALAFYLLKMELRTLARAIEPPESLMDEQVRAELQKAEERLKAEFALDATYGTLFRVGRQGSERTWPVSGGSVAQAGMATPRAISFTRRDSLMVGQGGRRQNVAFRLLAAPGHSASDRAVLRVFR